MSDKKPNIVIAGDAVWAGIDLDDCAEIKNAFVIQFENIEQMKAAIKAGSCEFDFMRSDEQGIDQYE